MNTDITVINGATTSALPPPGPDWAEYREDKSTTGSAIQSEETGQEREQSRYLQPIVNIRMIHAAPTEYMAIDELYPEITATRPEFQEAMRLMGEALETLKSAKAAYKDEDLMAGDNAIMSVVALLPELFCCRVIGEGFAAVVNAVMIGLDNAAGFPLKMSQVVVLEQVFEQLRSEPFLPFEEAVDLVMRLEDAGIAVEPREFEHLGTWLDEVDE